MNLPSLPMTREEFWRQYWDRIDVPVLGYTLNLPVPGERCWTWTGAVNSQAYGVVNIQNKKWLVHRVVHMVFSEELEDGLWVLHSCNNTRCVNPLHLRQGTREENWDDVLEDYELMKPVTDYMEGR